MESKPRNWIVFPIALTFGFLIGCELGQPEPSNEYVLVPPDPAWFAPDVDAPIEALEAWRQCEEAPFLPSDRSDGSAEADWLDLRGVSFQSEIHGKFVEANAVQWVRLPSKDVRSAVSWIEGAPEIKGIAFSGEELSSVDLTWLQLKEDLRWLCFACVSIPKAELFSLPKDIKILDLSCSDISDEHIGSFGSNVSLRVLVLDRTNISDRFVGQLSKVAPNLEVLSLHGCGNVTEEASQEIQQLTRLKWLNVVNSSLVTRGSMRTLNELQESLPGCTISAFD